MGICKSNNSGGLYSFFKSTCNRSINSTIRGFKFAKELTIENTVMGYKAISLLTTQGINLAKNIAIEGTMMSYEALFLLSTGRMLNISEKTSANQCLQLITLSGEALLKQGFKKISQEIQNDINNIIFSGKKMAGGIKKVAIQLYPYIKKNYPLIKKIYQKYCDAYQFSSSMKVIDKFLSSPESLTPVEAFMLVNLSAQFFLQKGLPKTYIQQITDDLVSANSISNAIDLGIEKGANVIKDIPGLPQNAMF